MDFVLSQRWNSRVKDEDTIFVLGDFCFKERESGKTFKIYNDMLNGTKVFIKGNHDRNNGTKACIEAIDIHLGGKDFTLVHRSENGNPYCDIVLCGHVHQHWKFKTWGCPFPIQYDCCNVGVDVWNFYPVTINEILKEYYKWKIDKKE